MKSKTFRIVFTGGGSGGPTIPLLAVHQHLLESLGSETLKSQFWGTYDGPEKEMVQQTNIPFFPIPSGKLRRYWSWKNFVDPIFILLGFFVGLYKLIRFRPHVVVSAGSFVSVPVAYAAKLLNIPHVIFQMDVHPGLANRLMAPASCALAYLFEQTVRHFPRIPKQKIGPVIRDEIQKASPSLANEQFRLKPDKPVIVVTGGGQGAVGLNQAVETVLDLWLEKFQVIHLTGKHHSGAKHSHEDYHAIPFVSEGMGNLLARSQFVVTRAGLGILGELAYLAKDTILVPLPGTHQEINCRAVVDSGGAVYLPQDQFLEKGPTRWKEFLETYQPNHYGKKLQELLPPGGTEAFASLILKWGDPQNQFSE